VFAHGFNNEAPMNLPRENPIIRATDPFARAKDRLAWRQVVVNTGLFIATLGVLYWSRHSLWRLALIPVLSAFMVRMFVLFHDCGHGSLFKTSRWNAWVGKLSGYVMGISFHGWHTEHAWHHRNQGRLDRRGIDMVNSPMTAAEAVREPAKAAIRIGRITAPNIFVLGAAGLLIQRKRLIGFFQFRPKFIWPVPNRVAIERNLKVTSAVHLLLHLMFVLAYGWVPWVTVFLPALFLAGGIGSWLFWVQHNFPQTYHADGEQWTFLDSALQGSSYLALPRPFAWVTAHIGLHHVHHLNPKIPNYNLDAARRAIPALNAVRPLTFQDMRESFTRVFWDERARQMVGPKDLSPR
jgi:omega-6 fatty acid desaturase (delta-12 desaturase)